MTSHLPRAEFSPANLSAFLRIRVRHAGNMADDPQARPRIEKAEQARLRRTAAVTNIEFNMAWMGRLLAADTRARLWGALGIVPADHRVRLTHGGQEDA